MLFRDKLAEVSGGSERLEDLERLDLSSILFMIVSLDTQLPSLMIRAEAAVTSTVTLYTLFILSDGVEVPSKIQIDS